MHDVTKAAYPLVAPTGACLEKDIRLFVNLGSTVLRPSTQDSEVAYQKDVLTQMSQVMEPRMLLKTDQNCGPKDRNFGAAA